MAIALPRHAGSRPVYMEHLYRDSSSTSSTSSSPIEAPPSLHSSKSSISCTSSTSSYDLHAGFNASRPLTPYHEDTAYYQDKAEDASIRSKSSIFSFRRFRFQFRLGRRGFSRSTPIEMTSQPVQHKPAPPSQISLSQSLSRRPSLPMLHGDYPPPRAVATYSKKPLPAVPKSMATDVTCQRCYYFAARHCNGWVIGGANGDACEMCLASGYFGAK